MGGGSSQWGNQWTIFEVAFDNRQRSDRGTEAALLCPGGPCCLYRATKYCSGNSLEEARDGNDNIDDQEGRMVAVEQAGPDQIAFTPW